MVWLKNVAMSAACAAVALASATASAQEVPGEYETVLSTLGKTGDSRTAS